VGVWFTTDEKGAPVVIYGEPPRPYRPPTQVDVCAEWLVGVLAAAGGPVAPKEVMAQARVMGFKAWAVYQARKRLEGTVVDTETKYSPVNCWALGGITSLRSQ
jgi:hypothetical protein